MCGNQKTTWLLFILTVTSSVSCVMLPTPRTADCITAELVNYNASEVRNRAIRIHRVCIRSDMAHKRFLMAVAHFVVHNVTQRGASHMKKDLSRCDDRGHDLPYFFPLKNNPVR